MIDETKQQTAIDYVFGELPPAEAIAFEKTLATDVELRELTRDLKEGCASLALEQSPVRPDPGLFSRVLTRAHAGGRNRLKNISFLPWAFAACLSIDRRIAEIHKRRCRRINPTCQHSRL